MCAPVNQSLDDGHLRLLELLFGVTTSRVRKIDGMADLNVVREGDILHLDTERSWHQQSSPISSDRTHSWVSHLPKSLTSWPSLEMSLGRVVAIFIGLEEDMETAKAWKKGVSLTSSTVLSSPNLTLERIFALVVHTKNQGLRRSRHFPEDCIVARLFKKQDCLLCMPVTIYNLQVI